MNQWQWGEQWGCKKEEVGGDRLSISYFSFYIITLSLLRVLPTPSTSSSSSSAVSSLKFIHFEDSRTHQQDQDDLK